MAEKEMRIGRQVLGIEDIEKNVKAGGEDFTIRLPKPFQRANIERTIARKIGVPLEQMDANAAYLIRAATYVDACLTKFPDWWSSAEECIDESITMTLYNEIIQFELEFRRKLQSGGFEKGGGKPTA